jgi:hypothetical protein
MGTNEDGLSLPAVRAGDGSDNVIGSLTRAPPPPITITKIIAPVLASGQTTWKCKGYLGMAHPPLCNGKMLQQSCAHWQFQQCGIRQRSAGISGSAQVSVGGGGGGWGTTLGLNYDILGTTAVVGLVEPALGCHGTSIGASEDLWFGSDGRS